MNLDTTFLIDLQREMSGKPARGARSFLQAHSSTRFQISVVTALEFLEGFSDRAQGNRCLMPFKQIPLDETMGRLGSRIRRNLRKEGCLIGDFDILIAATALHMGEVLVTANLEHFKRIPGLKCLSYRR
jgi:predicted nucleic acid-binding protein